MLQNVSILRVGVCDRRAEDPDVRPVFALTSIEAIETVRPGAEMTATVYTGPVTRTLSGCLLTRSGTLSGPVGPALHCPYPSPHRQRPQSANRPPPGCPHQRSSTPPASNRLRRSSGSWTAWIALYAPAHRNGRSATSYDKAGWISRRYGQYF